LVAIMISGILSDCLNLEN